MGPPFFSVFREGFQVVIIPVQLPLLEVTRPYGNPPDLSCRQVKNGRFNVSPDTHGVFRGVGFDMGTKGAMPTLVLLGEMAPRGGDAGLRIGIVSVPLLVITGMGRDQFLHHHLFVNPAVSVADHPHARPEAVVGAVGSLLLFRRKIRHGFLRVKDIVLVKTPLFSI